MYKRIKKYFKKKITKKSINQIIKDMFFMSVILFVISLTFDFLITYTIWIYAPKDFLYYESNDILKNAFLNNNIFFNEAIIINLFFLFLTIVEYWRYNSFLKRKFYLNVYIHFMFIVCLITITILHFDGGYSWLTLKN